MMPKVPKLRLAAVFLAIASVVLSACSDESSSSAATAVKIDACGLLDADRVGAAIGVPVQPGAEGRSAGGGENEGVLSTCNWQAPDDTPRLPTVTLMVWSWPAGGKGAQSYIQSFRDAAEQYPDLPKPEPVTMGDEAIWVGNGLQARKNDASISVTVSGIDEDKAKPAVMALAREVLDAL
jgi:hypothetical protein